MIDQDISRGDLVVIYWWDIEDNSEWQSLTEVEKETCPLCKNAGWYINHDEHTLRIAYSSSGTDETTIQVGRTVFPVATIKHVEKIRDDELGVT